MKAKTVKLDNLAKFLNGGTPSKEVNYYWTGTELWISKADIIGFDSAQPTPSLSLSLAVSEVEREAEGNNQNST